METIAFAQLVAETGELAGRRFSLDRPLITIGRSDDNDIVIPDQMVSKYHARITRQGDNYLIEDLQSSNGTVVNGQKVSSKMLMDGDKLFLGDTTISFTLGVPQDAAAPAAKAKKPSSSKKGLWIALGSVFGLLLVAGLVVLLVFLLMPEKDAIKPEVSIKSPQANQVIELNLPVGSGKEIPVEVTASDDKGLDKVEILVNDKVVKTLKAKEATKDADTGDKRKEEDFSFTWSTNQQGDYEFKAIAYDWKGNESDADPVTITIREGQDVAVARDYCAKIDGLITEFVSYRAKFNKAYTGAREGVISYAEAALAFNEVGNQRRSLQGRLSAIPPPAQFAAAQELFNKQISSAIQADDYAILWARDMQVYEMGGYPIPDPNDYESQIDSWSASTQSAGAAFKAEYNARRADQLGAPPGPDPTQ